MDHSGEKEFYTCLLYFFKHCDYLYLATFTTWRGDFILPCLFLLASVFFTPGVQLGLPAGVLPWGVSRIGWGRVVPRKFLILLPV